ncbi:MAG: beta strand repeat-containing protein [Candidatus Scalindua sp.]
MSHKKAKVYGMSAPFVNIGLNAPAVTNATRAPLTSDHGKIGDIWINRTSAISYILTQNVGGTFTWSVSSAGSGDLDTLTGDGGGAITPAGGNITLAGGTNITSAGAVNTITFNLDAAITLATSVTSPLYTSTAGMAITAAAGNDITIKMGDAAGANKVSFTDSADVEVFSIDSNGAIPAVSGLTVTGALTQTAGIVNIGQDNAANAINIGGGTAARAMTIASGAAAHTLAIGSASAGAMSMDTAAGISLDAATASNFTVTGAADLTIASTAGGVDLTSGEATATAISLDATNAAGGITMAAGTGGLLLGNQADCTTIDVGDFAPTASRTITIGGGTVLTAATTDTIDIAPDGVSTNADSIKTVNINAGNVTTGQLITNIAAGPITSGTHTTNIATGSLVAGTMGLNVLTGTGTKAFSIGNADGLTTVGLLGNFNINNNQNNNTAINTGTSTGSVTIGNSAAAAITLDTGNNISIDAVNGSNITISGGGLDIDATGQIAINASTSSIEIGNDADAQPINIGTGASLRPITIGNVTGATAINMNVGTGNFALEGNVASTYDISGTGVNTGTITVGGGTGAQTLNMMNSTGGKTVAIASGAGSNAVTIGSTNTTSALTLQAGSGEITMTGTVKEVTSEFLTRSGDSITFTTNPVGSSTANTGGTPVGSNGTTNIWMFHEGIGIESFNIGTQTIIAPRMDATGLSCALDQNAGDGVEYNFGAGRTNSRHAFTIGTSAAFFFEVTMNITDISAGNPFVIGFRKSQANNQTWSAYTDYYALGMVTGTSIVNVTLSSELNGAGQVLQNSNTAWTGGDGGTTTLRVLVSASGVVTATIDGNAPAAPLAYTFDNADVVVPYVHLVQGPDLSPVHLIDMKCGFQA